VRDAAPRCVWPGCEDRALQQSSGPEGSKYYTGCTRHYTLLGVQVSQGAPRPYECTKQNPCGNCAVCWD
jgi:ferredoxin